jgi:predicted RNA-binding protein associated with RNAse of E/G family
LTDARLPEEGTLPPGPAGTEVSFVFLRPPDRRVIMRTRLLEAREDLIVVRHQIAPSKPFIYEGEVVMDRGYRAMWFLFKGQPYDVGCFYRPDGTWTGYYADVLEPVRWTGADPRTLEPLVDLFLDLWVAPGGGYAVLDEDEFAEAIDAGRLTDGQIAHARRVIGELTDAAARGLFPPPVVREFQERSGRAPGTGPNPAAR